MGCATTTMFYITHIKNASSILHRGILSHALVEAEGIQVEHIYDAQIVSARRDRIAPNSKSLWEFANLYFQPRNAMLYRVKCEKPIEDIVILAVRPDILDRPDIFISMGNAASPLSEILPAREGRRDISKLRQIMTSEFWKEEDGSKRKMMAECLVPDVVPPDYIQAIYVANHHAAEKAKEMLQGSRIPIVPEPGMFFEPVRRIVLTPCLTLVEGDMFFSGMQTLTVSVNCVGVMGKGLASRAKYQFPDVYVLYQDLCRKRTLKIGKPYLYKRETSFDYPLADEPSTLSKANSEKWFLLFPTKQHWRYRADIKGIEKGLEWLRDNYKKEGITSLAVPALGCGLGWLEWHEVGPLLCKHLSTFDIPVWIYLPVEKRIPDEQLSKDFLLRDNGY